MRLVVMALVTLSHVTSTASAQAETTRATEATSATDAEARGLFEAGRAAFADGRFEDARDYFARSYELSRRPQLLYNLGTAEDRLRHDEAALASFEGYLAALPEAENASEVRGRIEVLRRAIAERGTEAPAPVRSDDAAVVPIGALVLGGLALVAAGASIGTWVTANDAYADRERGCFALRGGCTADELSGVGVLVDATNGLWIASVALAVGAAVSLPIELTAGGSETQATIEIGPGRLAMRGSF